MIARIKRPSLLVLASMMVPLVAGAAFSQTDWDTIFRESQRVPMEGWGGTGYGEVGTGFASFALDLDYIGPLTLEVLVTEERQGTAYSDDDSMLWLFDSQGYLLAENDDSPFGDTSQSLINGFPIDSPGRYYVVVTTYDNRPETDMSGRFVSLGNDGESSIAFELIVEYGMRDGPGYGDDGYYGDDSYFDYAETAIWFDDFWELAAPIRYTGEEVTMYGSVTDGVELYHLTVDEPMSVSVEAYPTGGETNDTVMAIMDSFGHVVAEDDDGGSYGGSLVYDVFLNPDEEYFVAVSGYPNWPNYDEFGFVEGYALRGEGAIDFELIVGPPREGGYYDEEPFWDDVPTSIWFDDFRELATPVRYTGDEMIMAGYVTEGVSLYHLTVDDSIAVSVEVHAQDGAYGDTTLVVMDTAGTVLAEDDDSAGDGGSLVYEIHLEPREEYFIAVASYPNWPNYDEFGTVEGYALRGEYSIDFDLVIGPPREGEYYGDDGYWEGLETAIWFDEFPDLATPVHYTGSEVVLEGEVSDGVALYRVTTDGPTSLSVMARARGEGYADTTLTVIDAEGYVVAEDDDGAGNGGSLIYELTMDRSDGYYVAVASYPNWPNRDEWGYIEGYPLGGEGYIEYELILGPPVDYGDAPYGDFGDGGPTPDGGFAAYGIDEVSLYAQYLPVTNGRGIGSGEVGTGFAVFAIEIMEPSALTIEVVVTEVRQGTGHNDTDSMLSLWGSDGLWYASDDDGGADYASKIQDVWLSQAGIYYAIVTTHPNEPESSYGFFDYVEAHGESNIAFDLVVRQELAQQ